MATSDPYCIRWIHCEVCQTEGCPACEWRGEIEVETRPVTLQDLVAREEFQQMEWNGGESVETHIAQKNLPYHST